MIQTLLASLFMLVLAVEDHSSVGSLLVVDKGNNVVSIVDLDAGKEVAKFRRVTIRMKSLFVQAAGRPLYPTMERKSQEIHCLLST